jgi:hypothetical protein
MEWRADSKGPELQRRRMGPCRQHRCPMANHQMSTMGIEHAARGQNGRGRGKSGKAERELMPAAYYLAGGYVGPSALGCCLGEVCVCVWSACSHTLAPGHRAPSPLVNPLPLFLTDPVHASLEIMPSYLNKTRVQEGTCGE